MLPTKDELDTAYRLLGEATTALEREKASHRESMSLYRGQAEKIAVLELELRQAREALDHQRRRNRELRVTVRFLEGRIDGGSEAREA